MAGPKTSIWKTTPSFSLKKNRRGLKLESECRLVLKGEVGLAATIVVVFARARRALKGELRVLTPAMPERKTLLKGSPAVETHEVLRLRPVAGHQGQD